MAEKRLYFADFRPLQVLVLNYDPAAVSRIVSPNDTMKGSSYFSVGTSAIEVNIAACIAANLAKVSRVLDLPCGHGRVLRHLVQLFPDAEFSVCDLDVDGVFFCASTFGTRPIYSKDDLTTVTPATCRVRPRAGIKVGIGRRLNPARDAEQRAEGVERVETSVEAERELIEVGL